MTKTFSLVASLIALCLSFSAVLHAQQDGSVTELEASIDKIYGAEKLEGLITLSEYYEDRDSRKAIRFARQAVELAERMFRPGGQVPTQKEIELCTDAYTQLATVQYERGTYFESRKNFMEASAFAEKLNDQVHRGVAETYLFRIDSMVADGSIKENFFTKNLGNLNLGKVMTDAATSASIETELLAAQAKEKRRDFTGAIEQYTTVLSLLQNTGDVTRMNTVNLKIASLYDSLGQFRQSQKILADAIEKAERDIRSLPPPKSPNPPNPASQSSGSDDSEDSRDLEKEKQNLKEIADQLARNKEYEKSIEYYKLYTELSERMYEDSIRTAVENENREQEILMLSQQKQIADLSLKAAQAENLKQTRMRNNLLFIASGILLAGLVVVYFYVSKRKEHSRLRIAYSELDQTKTKLENAEQRIVRLLAQQVSGDVANQLIASDGKALGERLFVCIMFLDIRDFTERAETMSPEDLILYQNNVFSMMIDIVQRHHGTINQLLGDGFMATFGAPLSHGNDCQNAYDAAKEILKELREKIEEGTIPQTLIGIGLHAGYVVTGNVGSEKRKQYSITGNAVIIASRVEQLNKTYKSQLIITEDVYNNLAQPLKLNQPFLEVTVKGRTQPVKILKIA